MQQRLFSGEYRMLLIIEVNRNAIMICQLRHGEAHLESGQTYCILLAVHVKLLDPFRALSSPLCWKEDFLMLLGGDLPFLEWRGPTEMSRQVLAGEMKEPTSALSDNAVVSGVLPTFDCLYHIFRPQSIAIHCHRPPGY
jgi:hypothetical protein